MTIPYSPKNNPRVIIIQKLYGKFFNDEEKLDFPKHRFKKFIKDVVSGTIERNEILLEELDKNLGNEFKFNNLDKLFQVILKSATYELLYKPNVSIKIIIKEYLKNRNHWPLDYYFSGEDVGDDFVVYANSITDQNQITGYRDGDNWYDATGLPITDPSVLNLGSGVIPFLQDPDHVSKPNGGLTGDAFEDYTPEVMIEPRISFNFPISDQAMFFAHYDILTQRPSSSSRMNPYDFLYLASRAGDIQNPNLKMERTIDYEVGFKQALNERSALQISAFYKNLKDMVQQERVNYAYPISYTHYNNIDFGNVKGFSFNYELRKTGNLSTSLNMNERLDAKR